MGTINRPNSSLINCLEEINIYKSWLWKRIFETEEEWIFLDFPGQFEIFIQTIGLNELLLNLSKECNLSRIFLIDSVISLLISQR